MTEPTREWRAVLDRLAAQASREALAVLRRVEQIQAETSVTRALLAAGIVNRIAQAWALSDISLAARAEELTGTDSPPLGIGPEDDEVSEHIFDALEMILSEAEESDDAAENPEMRIGRLAESEVWDGGREGLQEAMAARGVTAWRRIVQPDACAGACPALTRCA